MSKIQHQQHRVFSKQNAYFAYWTLWNNLQKYIKNCYILTTETDSRTNYGASAKCNNFYTCCKFTMSIDIFTIT